MSSKARLLSSVGGGEGAGLPERSEAERSGGRPAAAVPNPECTAGSNCYFDVFTPKRFGYLTLYQRSIENPSPAGPLGIFCHPSSGNFDNYALNANADAAMQGIAVRSGLAFATGTNCSDTRVGSTDYSSHWKAALAKGFHLAPVADHDSHGRNSGQGIQIRTVYVLPNGTSPVLARTAPMQAHASRHFFASEDSNAQLVFTTTGGNEFSDATGTNNFVYEFVELHWDQ
jgi:hypothetical protein